MQQITLAARAKINLTLDVLGKRSDGYHEVAMIMQSLELADLIHITPAATLVLETDDPRLAADETNLAYRAAVLLQREYNIRRGAHIRLEKKIPLAAGLAGGSSDAAAVLKGLARLWELPLDTATLGRLGSRLGSDVPFCLAGGTALASGRGEVITPLADLPPRPVVLAKPPFDVSTAAVYGQYRPDAVAVRPDTAAVLSAVGRGDWRMVEAGLVNVLESVTLPLYPRISAAKAAMLAAGADACLMSGSGPTVFGLAADTAAAGRIAGQLRAGTDAAVFVTATSPREEL
ncbi:MAG: 4-(cytidine 5'-diphospho)-2-C-methyl-D-erythritol kinase [Sporomusaceae bacterium]|nr:4-(cytidine 5'-diphospho)-2-C-methyl-D-erythritol kinase [Sporomusaceae bacterium]